RCVRPPYHMGPLLLPQQRAVQSTARAADFVLLGTGPWKPGFTALEFVRHLGLDPSELQETCRGVVCLSGYHALDAGGNYVKIQQIDDRMPRSLSFHQLRALVRRSQSR